LGLYILFVKKSSGGVKTTKHPTKLRCSPAAHLDIVGPLLSDFYSK